MKNSIIKYDRTDIYEGYSITDYTTKHLSEIHDLSVINDPKWIEYYQLTDNETIEQVSYSLYGTAMYWDIILFINKIDPLIDMVYDFDLSRDTAEKYVDTYANEIYVGALLNFPQNLPTAYLDVIKDEKTEEYELLKEKRRTIKVIRHNKILDFMKILRQQEII